MSPYKSARTLLVGITCPGHSADQSWAQDFVRNKCTAKISEGHLWEVEATFQIEQCQEQFFGCSWSCKAAPASSADAYLSFAFARWLQLCSRALREWKKYISVKEFVLPLECGANKGLYSGEQRNPLVLTVDLGAVAISSWICTFGTLDRRGAFCSLAGPHRHRVVHFYVSAQEKAEHHSCERAGREGVLLWMLYFTL